MNRSSLILNFAFFFGIPHIYGPDNRQDIKDVKDPKIIELSKSVAALIPNKNLNPGKLNQFWISAPNFIEQYQLIKGPLELSFGDQPTAAKCSGVLISENLILTAGHCVEDKKSLAEMNWVFDYKIEADSASNSKVELDSKHVYKINRIVEDYFHPYDIDGHLKDYAIVELDRPVLNRPFARFNFEERKSLLMQKIGMLGFPSGLPLKYTNDARILSISEGIILNSDLDAFGGNSGSPVFLEQTGEVLGVLVRGPLSFEPHFGSLLYKIKQVAEVQKDTPLTDIYDIRDIPFLNKKEPYPFEVKEVPCVMRNISKLCVKAKVERNTRKTLEELEIYGIVEKLWNNGKAEIEWHSPWGPSYKDTMQIDRVIPSVF